MVRGTKKRLEKSITTKEKTPEKINIDLNMSIHNKFDIEVVDAATGKIKQKAVAYNTICDGLWTKLNNPLNPKGYFEQIALGDGNGTPASSDTDLFNRVYTTNIITFPSGVSHDDQKKVFSFYGKITLNTTQGNGYYFSEVGIGGYKDYSYSSGSGFVLVTHAMFQDMNGNPITIIKTETDILNITATLYLHYGTIDNGHIVMNGYRATTRSWIEALLGNAPVSSYGTPEFRPSIAPIVRYAAAFGVYSQTEYSGTTSIVEVGKAASFKANRIEYNQSNGAICGIAFISDETYTPPYFIVGGDWFPCSTITSESVGTGDGVTTEFALKFPYAKNAKIYVDGVIDNSASVKYIGEGSNLTMDVQFIIPRGENDYDVTMLQGGVALGGTRYFYNRLHEVGIYQITKLKYTSISVSNDLVNWTEIGSSESSNKTLTVPINYRNYKYWMLKAEAGNTAGCWKINSPGSSSSGNCFIYPPSDYNNKAIHFTTPPPEGATITADYECDCIAKDENHVFDFSFSVRLGEYTGDDV